mmetsp:Transcript_39341/g.58443  ORF Transcript_39341/g.58443 Transcript_39341/m.58443 type:complete len:101 (-) Transcript_39341:103-405(-)
MAPNSSRNGKDQRKEGDDAVTSTEYVTLNERSKDDYFLLAFGEKEDPDVTACGLDAEKESSSIESCDEDLDSFHPLGQTSVSIVTLQTKNSKRCRRKQRS